MKGDESNKYLMKSDSGEYKTLRSVGPFLFAVSCSFIAGCDQP